MQLNWPDTAGVLGDLNLPKWASVVFAAVAVLAIANLCLSIFLISSYQPPFTPLVDAAIAPASKPAIQVSAITRSNLFGTVSGNTEQQLRNIDLPKTRLELQLRGVFTASKPELASAIIESTDKRAHSYKVNASIDGDAVLHSVYSDRVLLKRNGQLETLYFPEPESQPQGLTTHLQGEFTSTTANPAMSSHSSMTADQRKALIRSRLQELRDRVNSTKAAK